MFIVKILTHARPAELYCQLHSSCVSWLHSQSSESFKRFFSPSRLLHQKTMITIENDVVARDVLRTLIKFYDAFAGRLGMVAILFCLFFVKRFAAEPELKWDA